MKQGMVADCGHEQSPDTQLLQCHIAVSSEKAGCLTVTLPSLLSAMAADPVLRLRQARNSTTELVGKTASLVIWQRITIGRPNTAAADELQMPQISTTHVYTAATTLP